jgi:hypothetical protein
MIPYAFILALVFSLLGCNSEDPHPELKDPIYKDLKGRAEAHAKAIEESEKRLAELRGSLAKAEANSIEQKDFRKGIAKEEAVVHEGRKWSKYYNIRAARRAVVDKISAREAASVGEEWPKKSEYSDYLLNKRLREAPPNWNARVPRLQDRLKKAAKEKEPAAPAH